MSGQHIILRESRYHYVCRVPKDLLSHFPKPVIWKSLKTSDIKCARVLASAWEFRTQQLFMQIRTGMLDSELIDHLIAMYLQSGLNTLETKAFDRPFKAGEIETMLDTDILNNYSPSIDILDGYKDFSSFRAEQLRSRIETKDHDQINYYTNQLVKIAKNKFKVKLDPTSKIELGIKVLQCEKQLNEINSAIQRGELLGLQLLKDKVNSAKSYFDLNKVITKYKEKYAADKPDIKAGTLSDMEVECKVLIDVFGNISIDHFNSIDSITHLKKVLIRYPKNRIQRFGPSEKRSISSILKTEKNYEIISPKTANEYIKRAKALVDYAINDDMLNKANKWTNQLFKVELLSEEGRRQAYDDNDISRLVDAICTKDLWSYNKPKPERFWIVLIALFHGLRLSNITQLNKSDICLTNSEIWVFRVRFGKTKNTIKDYPIHDCLLLLGFLDWVEKLDRKYLFQDSSEQISRWWNRVDKDKAGNVKHSGFEFSYITKEPTKCLYSLRHHYAGEVYNASGDYKATAEALGHSLSDKVTNGYIGKIRLAAHKKLTDQLNFAVDLNKLEVRAQELFNLN